jgi:DNA/RNA endonuclease G (NUC1)
MKKVISLAFGLCILISGYCQTTTLIKHTWYTITFNTDQCSAIMGYYLQTAEHAAQRKKVARSSFRKDELAPESCDANFNKEYAAYNKQYKSDLQQRMDKGHINPYDAFTFSEDAAKETMLYDNVCPQISHVNQQEWRQVEAEVMDRSERYGDVKVWTGVLISKAHPRYMGSLLIPDYYWKIIAYKKNGTVQREAWLSSNKPANTHTKAIQARSDPARVIKVIRQYYPKYNPGF